MDAGSKNDLSKEAEAAHLVVSGEPVPAKSNRKATLIVWGVLVLLFFASWQLKNLAR
jgi:hypothetical protein